MEILPYAASLNAKEMMKFHMHQKCAERISVTFTEIS